MSGDGIRAPGPRGLAVARLVLERARGPFDVMLDLADRYGDLVQVRVGGVDHFLVSDPDLVRHILIENARNYRKGPGYSLWARILGEGLVTSDGEHWRVHRRLVQPTLHHDRMDRFVTIMAEVAQEEAIHLSTRTGDVVDLYDRTTRVALRIAARSFLGSDLRDREDDVCSALVEVFDHIQAVTSSPLRVVATIPGVRVLDPALDALRRRFGRGERRFEAAMTMLETIVAEVIARRRAEFADGREGEDLVSRLLRGAAATPDVTLSDRDLRDEVMTMFVAGHETAATGLAWCLRLLAEHPRHQALIASEARAAAMEGPLGSSDLERLPHARRVFRESLRLYPPVWQIARKARGDDRLADVHVRAGSTVIVSPYLLHRDPSAWDDPASFRPARFDRAWPRDAFLPFGMGQRMCPGGSFATAEAQILLGTILRDLVVEPASSERPAFDPRLTLRPLDGMPLRVRERPPGDPDLTEN